VSKTFFITTPIYYVNSVPHIGTTLTTVVADVVSRYQKMRGVKVHFLTGTDENGTKVLEAAENAGKSAQAFVDDIAEKFKTVFQGMSVEYDDFIRTTEPRHREAVQRLFEILREKGHIYKGKYEGWYDVGAETFVKESDVVDGKSPDGNPVRWVEEENWFFRLSAFEEPLLEYIEEHPGFLLPISRKNEVVNFIKSGLRDMCITRANAGWGIPVPDDPDRVVYVWFDALINYVSATGWPHSPDWDLLWPADVHWMAKEIYTRFHATLWPAMLMGAELPLPKTIIAHGWFVFGDGKMSKSKGNVIAPMELVDDLVAKSNCDPEVAVDAVRYSLVALLPYEGDTNYTREEVYERYNFELANDLGNALNRSIAIAHKFLAGKVPEGPADNQVVDIIADCVLAYENAMDELRLNEALAACWGMIRHLNKYIDTEAPWNLAKEGNPKLGTVVRSMLLELRAAEGMIRPVMPQVADRIAEQLQHPPLTDWDTIGTEDSIQPGTQLAPPKPIFPRIDKEKMHAETQIAVVHETEQPENPVETLIGIEDFTKVKLKVGRVLEAEPVEGSAKLLKLQVLIGNERRQVLAGIQKSYQPLDLIGRQVIVVTNLKPANLMGHESQGMILAADAPGGGAIFLTPESEAPEGTSVH